MIRRWQLLALVAALALLPLIHGAIVQPALNPVSYLVTGNQTIAGTNRMVNISITNLNTSANITSVNVTLPAGFVYVNVTNQTSATEFNFTNTTNADTTVNLSWYNTSTSLFNDARWFAFNATVGRTGGAYNITVYVADNSSINISSTNLTITVIGTNSSSGNLSANPATLEANWTPATFLLISNNNFSNISVAFNDTNTTIIPLSFVASTWPQGAYPALTAANVSTCFGGALPNGTAFQPSNGTAYNSTIPLNLFNPPAPAVNISIVPIAFCPPGQYRGNFTIVNMGLNTSDSLSLRATLDILLNASNTFRAGNLSNITGWLRGNLTAGNVDNSSSPAYQRFFFSSNRTHNQTSVTINLTGTDNADIFLLNGSTASPQLLGRSLRLGTDADSIDGIFLPANQLLELRVAGNQTTDYNALLYFAPLNVTNQSTLGENVTELDYGTFSAHNDTNSSSRQANFSLITTADTNITNLAQSVELWHVDRLANGSGTNESVSYWTFVPNFTQKLEVLLEWNRNATANTTVWGLNLTRPNGTLVNSSNITTTISSNASNTTVVARLEHFGPFNYTNEGWWNVTVVNLTNGNTTNATYNLTVRAYLPASEWVRTNFSSPSTLYSTAFALQNTSYAQNNSVLLQTNITTPTYNVLNGSFEGAYRWFNGTGWVVKVPFKFNVLAGGLAINSSIRNFTASLTQNIGLNESAAAVARTIFLTWNNTGWWPFTLFNSSNSSINLSITGPTINATVSSAMPMTLGSNQTGAGSGSLAFLLNISRLATGNTSTGIYIGNLLFNASNNTNSSNQSYPVQLFNLSLRVNLTDKLRGAVTSVTPTALPGVSGSGLILNSTNSTYFTAAVNVSYANGSGLTVAGGINSSLHFHSMWLNHTNISNITYLANISAADNTTALSCAGTCNLGATIPPGLLPGGNYTLAVEANWNGTIPSGFTDVTNLSTANLTGVVSNRSVVVDASGLFLAHVTGASLSVNEVTSQVYNVSVTNYGTRAFNGTLSLTPATNFTIEAKNVTGPGNSDCRSSTSGASFTMNVPANSTTCYAVWLLTTANISSSVTSTSSVVANGSLNYSNSTLYDLQKLAFNSLTGISFTDTATDAGSSSSSSGSSSGGGGGGAGASCTSDSNCSASFYCSGSTCKALSCTADQFVSNHACKDYVYKIDFLSGPSALEVLLGSGTTAAVEVKNTGDKDAVVTIDADAGAGVTSSNATTNLSVGKSASFNLTLNTTADAPLGNHSGSFRATRGSTVIGSRAFTLTVLPTEEKKAAIKAAQSNLSAFLPTVEAELNAAAALNASDPRVAEARAALAEAKAKLAEASTALAAGDYAAADAALVVVKSDLEKVRALSSAIRAANEAAAGSFWSGLWIWIVVAIAVVAVIIIVVYMLLPPSTPKGTFVPQKGFVPPSGKQGLGARLRNLFKRKPKQPATAQPRFQYTPPAQGLGGKLKSLFKRKRQGIYAFLPAEK